MKIKAQSCPIAGCPTIIENGEEYIIVGKILNDAELDQIKNKVGEGETAVKIPKNLIDDIK